VPQKKRAPKVVNGGNKSGSMDVEARSGRKPGPHFRMLVGRVVVHDEMNVEFGRDRGVDMLQEVQELLVAMTLSALRDHLTVGDVESRE
jgi:hypothetical protein